MTSRSERAGIESISAEMRAAFPSEVSEFDDLEQWLAEWHKGFKNAEAAARYEEASRRESGRITARRRISHLYASVSIRIVDLGSGLITLINARHVRAMAHDEVEPR